MATKSLRELEKSFSKHYPPKKHKALYGLLERMFEQIRELESQVDHLRQFAPPGFDRPTRTNLDIKSPPLIPPEGGIEGGLAAHDDDSDPGPRSGEGGPPAVVLGQGTSQTCWPPGSKLGPPAEGYGHGPGSRLGPLAR